MRCISQSLLLLIGLVSASTALADCDFELEVGDGLTYSTSNMEAEASCGKVAVTITHTGQMPRIAMGHNWVLTRPEDFQGVAPAGMAAGPEGDYVPAGDSRIIANTRLVGGGETDTVEFSLQGLAPGDYTYFCSFPGHWTVMKGTFTIR